MKRDVAGRSPLAAWAAAVLCASVAMGDFGKTSAFAQDAAPAPAKTRAKAKAAAGPAGPAAAPAVKDPAELALLSLQVAAAGQPAAQYDQPG